MPEIRAVFRLLWRSRTSSLAAVCMLAAAAAVATATFSLADALLWRALPYRDAQQLAMLVTTHANGEQPVSMPDLTILRDETRQARLAAAGTFSLDFALGGFGEPRQLRVRQLTADYFETLGVPLVAGRDFRRDEERTGAGTVAILTDRLWADLFGRRPDVLGTPLSMNGRSYVIAGILPPYRDPFGEVDIYVPHQFSPTLTRQLRLLTPIARLAEGVSQQTYQHEIERLTGNTGDPDAAGHRIELISLHARLGARHRSAAAMLFGGAVALLAIALLNFAVLAATRARLRISEFTTRLALGATRSRILTLAVLELLPLALAAMVLAIPAGALLVNVLRGQYAENVVTEIAVDARAVAFLAAILAVAVATAFVAASRSFRAHLVTQRAIASSRLAGGRSFVVVQMALSLALVIGAGLLAKSFVVLSSVDPGFETRNVHTTRMALPAGAAGRYATPESRVRFWQQLLDRLEHAGLPAGLTTDLPLSGQGLPTAFSARMANGDAVPVKIRAVSRGFFDRFEIPIRTGRSIADSDVAGAPRVVVINRSLAARVAIVGPALGQKLEFNFIDPPFAATVVGIADDIQHAQLGTVPSPEAYFSFAQTPQPTHSLVLSSNVGAERVGRVVRQVVDTLDRGIAFRPITPMTDYVQRNLAAPRVQLELTSSYALVALVVAAAGLYSLLAFLAAGSRREWAIRLALGATPRRLQLSLFRLSLTYGVLAAVLGIALVAAVGRGFTGLLYGVAFWDPLIVASSTAVMIATCLAASIGPALRVRDTGAVDSLRA
jgi:putative ABC transport system permease protein